MKKTIALIATVLSLFLASSASAHSVAITAASCGSMTITWSNFSSSGNGNGGVNAPTWSYTFTPTVGAPTAGGGQVSFTGSSFSFTTAIPAVDGTVVVSTAWTAATTRDGATGSASDTFVLSGCAAPPIVPIPPVGPVPPATPGAAVTPTTTAAQNVKGKKRRGPKKVRPKRHRGSPFTG
jgi:hypothetical protein